MEKPEILLCSCGSAEHQLIFIKDLEDKMVYAQIHLTTYRNFYKRLLVGIKYAFGHRSVYGEFDEIIITKNNYSVMKDVVNFLDEL